jgi:hypothetical protein
MKTEAAIGRLGSTACRVLQRARLLCVDGVFCFAGSGIERLGAIR